jgi:caffeoyl-CoA O-methyltransferase
MKSIAQDLELKNKAIQVAPYEGQILSTLVRLKQPTISLEIGTLFGYSACWILEALGKKSKLITVEQSKENYESAQFFLSQHEKSKQLKIVNASGLDFLATWPKDEKIDFLFLDADKGNYLNYLNLAKPYLSKGALVVADNSFLFGYVLENSAPSDYSKNTWRSMRELNKVLSGKTGEFSGMALPTLQGMTVGVKL